VPVTIRLPSAERFLAAATPSTKDITRIKRKALRKMHGKVMRQSTKPDRTSDKFVDWKFKQDWEKKDLPLQIVAGTDYDYFDAAVNDCIQLFHTWGFPGRADPDAPGRFMFGPIPGDPKYNSMYGIWQNGKYVGTSPHNLSGPWVDFGPTADYALFLEKSVTRSTNNMSAPLLRGVGVIHGIADRVARRYSGVHRVFAHVQKPKDNQAHQRLKRAIGAPYGNVDPNLKAIELFPVIRIMHRHWR